MPHLSSNMDETQIFVDNDAQNKSVLLFNLRHNLDRINIFISSERVGLNSFDAIRAYKDCKELLITSYNAYRQNVLETLL